MEDTVGWAWFAGLFEGEGCISFTGSNSVALVIVMTDEDVLLRASQIVGGRFERPRERPGIKKQHVWITTRADEVESILRGIMPWLGERRKARAEAALERLKGCRRYGHCKRGHPMSGDNLYVAPGCKQRICRACARIRDKQRKPRNETRDA